MNELPLGAVVDPLPPGVTPPRQPIEGDRVRLVPVDPAAHAEPLFRSSHPPEADATLWAYLPYGPFADQSAFTDWLVERAAATDPLFFTVIDRTDIDGAGEQPSGMASYLRITPAMGVIEIGHIWFAPRLQRSPQATEAIYLLARQAFDDLGNRRLEWKCNALNEASKRAALRFGFTYEGTFRQHLVVKGRNRDSAWFSMLDSEWPRVKANFEHWLSPENFKPDGRQRIALSELNAAET